MAIEGPHLFAIAVLRQHTTTGKKAASFLHLQNDLSTFNILARSSAAEIMRFTCRTVAERVTPGSIVSIEHEGQYAHVNCPAGDAGLVAVAVTNKDYPTGTAHAVVRRLLKEFLAAHPSDWRNIVTDANLTFPGSEQLFSDAKNPATADKLARVQSQVDETRDVLVKTLSTMMERGEDLNRVAQMSADLDMTSRAFVTNAKKAKKCCEII